MTGDLTVTGFLNDVYYVVEIGTDAAGIRGKEDGNWAIGQLGEPERVHHAFEAARGDCSARSSWPDGCWRLRRREGKAVHGRGV